MLYRYERNKQARCLPASVYYTTEEKSIKSWAPSFERAPRTNKKYKVARILQRNLPWVDGYHKTNLDYVVYLRLKNMRQ
jgi:hypothetical protein